MKIIEASFIRGSANLPREQQYNWIECSHCGRSSAKALELNSQTFCEICLINLIGDGLSPTKTAALIEPRNIQDIWQHYKGKICVAFAECFQVDEETAGLLVNLQLYCCYSENPILLAHLFMRTSTGQVVFTLPEGKALSGIHIAYMDFSERTWWLRSREMWFETVEGQPRFSRLSTTPK